MCERCLKVRERVICMNIRLAKMYSLLVVIRAKKTKIKRLGQSIVEL
mgnify:CR=1 FL=1